MRSLAREEGADAVGIASVDAINERAPDGYGITDIFHEVKTVIVAGVDETHENWLTDQDIDLDDAQASTSELTYVLSKREDV